MGPTADRHTGSVCLSIGLPEVWTGAHMSYRFCLRKCPGPRKKQVPPFRSLSSEALTYEAFGASGCLGCECKQVASVK